MTHPLLYSIIGACALMIVHFIFTVITGLNVQMLFMLFSVYNTACNGLKMNEYEMYWLMDFHQ